MPTWFSRIIHPTPSRIPTAFVSTKIFCYIGNPNRLRIPTLMSMLGNMFYKLLIPFFSQSTNCWFHSFPNLQCLEIIFLVVIYRSEGLGFFYGMCINPIYKEVLTRFSKNSILFLIATCNLWSHSLIGNNDESWLTWKQIMWPNLIKTTIPLANDSTPKCYTTNKIDNQQ